MSNFDNFTHVIAGHDEPQYVPFTVTDGGPSYGEIAVLRKGSHDGKVLVAGFWRVQPSVSGVYDIPLGDESGFVIEGSADIELLDTGKVIRLEAGQLYSFKKGTRTRWTILTPFKKFVVVSDSADQR